MSSVSRIVIIDDEMPARLALRLLLADIAADCPHVLVGEADNIPAAQVMAAWQPDIVLLDIQMPGSLAFAAQCRSQAFAAPAIIFVTAHKNFAVPAFNLDAADYLLKPVSAERLALAIRRALVQRPPVLQAADVPSAAFVRSHVLVQSRDQALFVPIEEVLCMKAEQKYVTLRTASHAYLIEESLHALEQEFAASFVRVHRNALVARQAIVGVERGIERDIKRSVKRDAAVDKKISANPHKIASAESQAWQIIVRGLDERLPISRRQWPKIKALVRPMQRLNTYSP